MGSDTFPIPWVEFPSIDDSPFVGFLFDGIDYEHSVWCIGQEAIIYRHEAESAYADCYYAAAFGNGDGDCDADLEELKRRVEAYVRGGH